MAHDISDNATTAYPYVPQVGDVVKIHKPSDTSEGPQWTHMMESLNGQVGTVQSIDSNGHVKIGEWYYAPHWLELVIARGRQDSSGIFVPVAQATAPAKRTMRLKVGDKVKRRVDEKNAFKNIVWEVTDIDGVQVTIREYFNPDKVLGVPNKVTDDIAILYRPRKGVPAPETVSGPSEDPEAAGDGSTSVTSATVSTPTLDIHEILGQDKAKRQLEVAAKHNIPVLLVGETGSGKTTIVKDLAIKNKKTWVRFNLTGETTVDEFVGKYTLQNKQTVWEDGILLQAMKQGHWIIVDEINVALPEILFVLHSLLDDDRNITVVNHLGEVVTPHPDFRFFGTMNPVDEYAGTKDLNKAFKSRFGMILNMGYPQPQIEAKIVAGKTGVDIATASQIVDVGQALRAAKDKNDIFYTCSTRDLIQWGQMSKLIGLKDAFEVTILNKANGDALMVNNVFKHVTNLYVSQAGKDFSLNINLIEAEKQKLEEDKKNFNRDKARREHEFKQEILKKLVGETEAETSTVISPDTPKEQ